MKCQNQRDGPTLDRPARCELSMFVLCCCIVGVQLPVAATATVLELVFASVLCVNVKKAA